VLFLGMLECNNMQLLHIQEYMHPNAIMRHSSKAIDGVLG